MSLQSIRTEAFRALLISANARPQPGDQIINVGESFFVTFTVVNTFSGTEGGEEFLGHAHFNDVKLRVVALPAFAEVVGGNRTFNITNHLGFGNSASVEVEFKALLDIPFLPAEPYARVTLIADFDIVRFFHIEREATFFTNIQPT